MLKKLANLVVVVLGVAAGLWLAQPVSAVQEGEYTVQAGDTLAGVAERLGVSKDDLVSWNAERYPAIADGRMLLGWELRYRTGGETSRWEQVWGRVSESAAGRWVAEWPLAKWLGMKGEQLSLAAHGETERALARGDAAMVADCLVRELYGEYQLYVDPDLMRLAQQRVEGSPEPLCDGCVELRFNDALCEVFTNEHLPDNGWIRLYRKPSIDVVRQACQAGSFGSVGVGVLRAAPNGGAGYNAVVILGP